MFGHALTVLLALTIAGCGGGGGSGGGGPGGGAAINGTERAYSRTDGAVTVTFNLLSNNYTATNVITISNDHAGANRTVVELSADAASITSSANASGYQFQVTLTATAPSDAQAREALATMSVSHRDATDPGVLYLINHVSVPNYSANGVSRYATVAAALPQALSHALYQQAGVGSIGSTGLHGTEADLAVGVGNATLAGTWDSATVIASVGSITLTANAANLSAATSVGDITANLPSLRATHAALDSSTGTVDVTVSHVGNGVFDADALAENSGSASISIVGTSPVGTQTGKHAHARSPDYDSGSPKIAVTAHTSSGNVSIHD